MVFTLKDVTRIVPELLVLRSVDRVIKLFRSSRSQWAPHRGDEMSRAMCSAFLSVVSTYRLHPEELPCPITVDLFPDDSAELLAAAAERVKSAKAVLLPENMDAEDGEMGEDLLAMSRDQGDEQLLAELGYSGLLFLHPCFSDERGSVTSLAACRMDQELVIDLAEPASTEVVEPSNSDSDKGGGGDIDKQSGDSVTMVCDSAEQLLTTFVDRLDGADSLFFLSGDFVDW